MKYKDTYLHCRTVIIIACLLLAPSPSFGALIEMFGIQGSYPLSPSAKYVSINPLEPSLTEIPSLISGSGYFFGDITFGTDGQLYASNIADATSEGLAVLNPADSAILSFLPYTGPNINYSSDHAIAFSPLGVLYLMNQNRLSIVNTDTGATSFQAEYSKHFKSISFSPDGLLFGLAITSSSGIPDELWEIDLDTFALSFVGDTHGSIDTMRFSPDGVLYGIASEPRPDARVLGTIDHTNGNFSSIGSLNGFASEISGLAIRAVPEPATLALFGIGLAGLGFARRKKSV